MDPVTPTGETLEVYGTWGYATYASVSKNQDGSSKVTYADRPDNDATYNPLQLTDFATLTSGKGPVRTIKIEITSKNAVTFYGGLCIKDDSGVVSVEGSTPDGTGDISWYRHSSGNGEYFTITPNGTGTITPHIADGKVQTKVRLLLDVGHPENNGEIEIGKITFTF